MNLLAYVDPSVMSYTVQAVAGVAIALGVIIGIVSVVVMCCRKGGQGT